MKRVLRGPFTALIVGMELGYVSDAATREALREGVAAKADRGRDRSTENRAQGDPQAPRSKAPGLPGNGRVSWAVAASGQPPTSPRTAAIRGVPPGRIGSRAVPRWNPGPRWARGPDSSWTKNVLKTGC
jgi:hypothetical protein